ncbi:MAG: hypothetical protein WAU01_10050, partial [Saprospiraceae bacterium]
MNSVKIWDNWVLIIIGCLTLGLAPYVPEPHIWGKLKWLMGGAVGMQLMDWGDMIMHGIPWILLLRLIIVHGLKLQKTTGR